MPKLIIATPSSELLEYLYQVVQTAYPQCEIITTQSFEEFGNICGQDHSITAAFCDVFWNDENYYTSVLLLSSYHPHIAWSLASPYDLSEVISKYCPFPIVSAPQSPDPIVSVLQFLFEDLRAQQIGDYFVESFAGQNYLGRSYRARHTRIERNVTLTIPSPVASEEFLAFFLNSASSMGQIIHPSIYSIYESGEANGRPYIAHEPVVNPTLLQLQAQNVTMESRIIAKILHTVGTCLNYLQSIQVSYRPIELDSITVSTGVENVVKIQNCGIPSTDGMVSIEMQLYNLSNSLMAFVPSPAALYPQLLQLLRNMQEQTVSLADFTQDAGNIELALAPVKAVPVREESLQVAKEITKARKMFWVYLISGMVAGITGLSLLTILIIKNYAPLPGHDYKNQIRIPSGMAKIPELAEPLRVNEFYMDEFEVTIGQYEKFLADIQGKPIEEILPDGLLPASIFPNPKSALNIFRQIKMDMVPVSGRVSQAFEPKDWKDILSAARVRSFYLNFKISRDTPVFNVDFIDALAYANWAGKRLPTELEWQRAASGDTYTSYPWGNDADFTKTNTGKDFEASPGILTGSIDGYQGPADVDTFTTDKSVWGVRGLEGNVSEWTMIPQELLPPSQSSFDPMVQAIHGGSYTINTLPPSWAKTIAKCTLRNPAIGIRVVSDRPVEPKKPNGNK